LVTFCLAALRPAPRPQLPSEIDGGLQRACRWRSCTASSKRRRSSAGVGLDAVMSASIAMRVAVLRRDGLPMKASAIERNQASIGFPMSHSPNASRIGNAISFVLVPAGSSALGAQDARRAVGAVILRRDR
jgi:hypothetical protein